MHNRIVLFRTCLAATVACCVAVPARPACGEELRLASEGRALQSVVVSDAATERVRAAAATLADYLGRITAAEFRVVVGDGAQGIAVGQVGDFAHDETLPLSPDRVTGREDYVLRTHSDGALLIGATEQAVEHAVWDFLYRLGHRQYFPGANWEVVPRIADARLDVDVVERPDFYQRTFRSGHGATSREQSDAYIRWSNKNRATAGLEVQAGHAYGSIIRANRDEFERHPEYLALVDGKRVPSQFCLSSPGLQKLVGEHTIRYFRENPDRDCISLEPNDGGGHCQCDACRAAGSVSDRVVTLANHAAEVANAANLGERYVGLLAYSRHAEAPTIRVHPRVIVRVSFYGESASPRTVQARLAQISAWQKQGATIGLSEYLNTFVWDHALPARAKGSNLSYLRQMLPAVHSQGARYFHSSLGDGWGPTGLGAYVAARILWDVNEADRVEQLVDEFLHTTFGRAAEPMAEFYRLIDAGNGALLSEDLLGRLYRTLSDAKRLASDAADVEARLDDLILYVRYVELHRLYDIADDSEKGARYVDLMHHSFRMRGTSMAHYRGAIGNIPRKFPGGNPPAVETWQREAPFTAAEIAGFVSSGIAANRLLDFTPVRYEDDLVRATPLQLQTPKPGTLGGYPPRVRNVVYTWLDEPGKIRLRIAGHGGHSGRAVTEYRLFSAESVVDEPVDRYVAVLERGNDETITLESPHAGRHWIEALGPSLQMNFVDEGLALTLPSSMDSPFSYPNWSLYFYVPRGTKVVGGFATTRDGRVRDGDGNEVFSFDTLAGPGYFSVPVPAGQDGKLWFFEKCRGRRLLLTVPPYLARTADELLLPQSVVGQDAPAGK